MADTTPNNVAPQSSSDPEANKPPTRKQDPKKIVRLMTVIAYIMSVSMAALMLSAYYIFLWNPKEHRHTGPLRLVAEHPCPDCFELPAPGVNHDQQYPVPQYNESQPYAETPRVLPAQELPLTTPLSRLAQQYLQTVGQEGINDTDTLSQSVHS